MDRWQRHDWWGVVLDTDDVETLTRFYAELRGWSIHHLDAESGSLDPAGHPFCLYVASP